MCSIVRCGHVFKQVPLDLHAPSVAPGEAAAVFLQRRGLGSLCVSDLPLPRDAGFCGRRRIRRRGQRSHSPPPHGVGPLSILLLGHVHPATRLHKRRAVPPHLRASPSRAGSRPCPPPYCQMVASALRVDVRPASLEGSAGAPNYYPNWILISGLAATAAAGSSLELAAAFPLA